ncbi:MAG: hypothetical protein RJB25_1201, partial [Bacteroidota bacterium]
MKKLTLFLALTLGVSASYFAQT